MSFDEIYYILFKRTHVRKGNSIMSHCAFEIAFFFCSCHSRAVIIYHDI